MAGGSTVIKQTQAPAAQSNYQSWADMLQAAQQKANLDRIPNASALEMASSNAIADLLNPAALYPDVARQAAETATYRGIAGSGAAYGTALRMSDADRLARIAMGEDALTAALNRNPTAPLPDISNFLMTPYQSSQYGLQQQELAMKQQELDAKLKALEEQNSKVGVTNLGGGAPGYYSYDTGTGRIRLPIGPVSSGFAGFRTGGTNYWS